MDIVASLEITEYIFAIEPTSVTSTTAYSWQNIYIEYKGLGYPIQATNVNGHWLVQVRRLLMLMGYTVGWKADTKQVTYGKDGVSGVLKSPITIYNGLSYGYVYQICNEFNLSAEWDADKRAVILSEV